jgi:hypothetical protein
MRLLILASLFVVCPSQALAQNHCEAFIGKTVKPRPIDEVFSQYSKVLASKGEYETTESFQQRLEKSRQNLPAISILLTDLNKNFVRYDADSKRLNVANAAFYGASELSTGYDKIGIKTRGLYATHYEFPPKATKLGGYSGSNAFGASVWVTKLNVLNRRVFDEGFSDDQTWGKGLFAGISPRTTVDVMSIEMSPEEAKAVKSGLTGAIVFVPKPPYFAEGSPSHLPPTIDAPLDTTSVLQVVIADIQCALLVTRANKVLAAIETY